MSANAQTEKNRAEAVAIAARKESTHQMDTFMSEAVTDGILAGLLLHGIEFHPLVVAPGHSGYLTGTRALPGFSGGYHGIVFDYEPPARREPTPEGHAMEIVAVIKQIAKAAVAVFVEWIEANRGTVVLVMQPFIYALNGQLSMRFFQIGFPNPVDLPAAAMQCACSNPACSHHPEVDLAACA